MTEKEIQLIRNIRQFQDGPGWKPKLYDFSLANCIYYDVANPSLNFTSERCLKVREDYKEKCWSLFDSYLATIGTIRPTLFIACKKLEKDPEMGPIIAQLFSNIVALAENAKAFT